MPKTGFIVITIFAEPMNLFTLTIKKAGIFIIAVL